MHVVIVGAGAMGTLIGHGLCQTSHQVTVLDTPQRIKQINSGNGLELTDLAGQTSHQQPTLATDDFAAAGVADVIILATKSHVLPVIAADLQQLMHNGTVVVPIQNGIPWWYLYNFGNEAHTLDADNLNNPQLQALDPEGLLHKHMDIRQVLGCVAYPAAMLDPTGQVTHVEGLRFPVGELNGEDTLRAGQVAQLFTEAGFKSRVINDIRSEIWLKCWGALSINPVSALTRATMVDICCCTETHKLIHNMMSEAKTVAEIYGAQFRHTISKRIEGARAVGAHKTSTLQDVEAGRPVELDAVMKSVLELAARVDVPTPTLDTVYACMALLNAGLQDPGHKSAATS